MKTGRRTPVAGRRFLLSLRTDHILKIWQRTIRKKVTGAINTDSL
jgi:hypothetical protein